MNTIFSTCLQPTNVEQQFNPQNSKLAVIHQTPFKYKVATALKIVDIGLKLYAQPRNKQKYTFQRNQLKYLSTKKSHVPFLYFPSKSPQKCFIFVYCHGSGSTLNNVYDLALSIFTKHKIAVVAFDYTGDGESQMKFDNYENDIKLVLAWVVSKGYTLDKTILSGFSLGTYSALILQGKMPRILISPICGILTFLEGQAKRFSGQKYDTVQSALKIKSKSLIFHCTEEVVPISHAQLIEEALKKDNNEEVIFYQITDKNYSHKSAPAFLCSKEGRTVLGKFLDSLQKDAMKVQLDDATIQLKKQLQNIVFYESENSNLQHLQSQSSKVSM